MLKRISVSRWIWLWEGENEPPLLSSSKASLHRLSDGPSEHPSADKWNRQELPVGSKQFCHYKNRPGGADQRHNAERTKSQ